MATTESIKTKLIDKINVLTSQASARELNFLSKSLETLNSTIKEDTWKAGSGEITRFEQTQIPRVPINNGNTLQASRQSLPAEFGIYGAHYGSAQIYAVYDEQIRNVRSTRWSWCHYYVGNAPAGGQWGYWATAQRHHCDGWNGNHCFWGQHGCTTSSDCYNTGSDAVNDLGHVGFVGGTDGGSLASRHWGEPSPRQAFGQISNIGPRDEMRNEGVDIGNAEVADKYSYVIYTGFDVKLRNKRFLPGAEVNYSIKGTSNGNIASFGSLTHNADRGELAVLNRNDGTLNGMGEDKYIFSTTIYKNCPHIDLNTDLNSYLNDTGKVQALTEIETGDDRTMYARSRDVAAAGGQGDSTNNPNELKPGSANGMWSFRMTSNPWDQYGNETNRVFYHISNYTENWQGIKICMTDNGDIYWSVANRWLHSLHKCTRYNVDGVTNDSYYDTVFVPQWSPSKHQLNVKGYDENRNHNIRGYEAAPLSIAKPVDWHFLREARHRGDDSGHHPGGNSRGPGHRIIQSRHKKNVAMMSQYYYWSSGLSSWVIDKRFNNYFTAVYNRDENHGCQMSALGKAGFIICVNRQIASANPSARVTSLKQDINSGQWFRQEHSRHMEGWGPGYQNTFGSLIPLDG